jgi:DNA-binding MarR family transcriptional regulator
MRSEKLNRVSEEILSISPLIFRTIRKKLTLTHLTQKDANITRLHFEIMRLLEEEGTLHVSEIGERLQIARAAMTKLIEKMVQMEIVERKTNREDRRQIDIILTERAKTVLLENKSKISSAFQKMLDTLSDEELENISRSFLTVRDLLSHL